jgi:hypothetical protein
MPGFAATRTRDTKGMDISIDPGRAAQDVGLAALLGGNLFGRLAMHPALRRVHDERERGAVVNNAWRRYGTVNSLSLAAVVAGWAGERFGDGKPRDDSLTLAKDIAVGAIAVTGLAAAAEGVRFSRACPGGAVPLEDGNTPAWDTPRKAARQKRVLNALSLANLGSEVALAAINAARPARRRLLSR